MTEAAHYLQGRLALRVVLVFAAAYVLSYALRAINAVIAPELMADLQLNNADLGLLSSAYFFGFGAMQLPIGIWLDRYGSRRTEAALLMFAAIGAAVFATSHTLAGLWVGRALIGVGVSSCLMAAMKAYRSWYAPEKQSQLASWMLVFGTLGALSTTVPVTAVMPLIGWRGVFWLIAALLLLAGLLVFFRLKAVEQHMANAAPSKAAQASIRYLQIFRDPYFRRMALLGAVHQGGFMAMQSLWAGPWMVRVLGLTTNETSQVLFVFNFFLMLSYLGLSWWAPRHVRYDGHAMPHAGVPVLRAVMLGLSGSIVVQGLIILLPYSWSWMLWIVFAVFITVTTLAQTHVSLAYPPAQVGRANSAFNLTLFIGAFSVQWGIGLLVDGFRELGSSDPTALRLAFGVYLALQLGALLVFIRSKELTAPVAYLNDPQHTRQHTAQ